MRLTAECLEDRTVPSASVDFLAAQPYGSGGSLPNAVATGDFNNDGIIDLVVTNSGSDTVGVLLGMSGGFHEASTFNSGGTRPRSIAVADFNHDGNADLAVANELSNNVGVLLGNGDGSFAPVVTLSSAGNNPASLAVGDFNDDGHLDLIVANFQSFPFNPFFFSPGNLALLLGDGNGGFGSAITFSSGGLNAYNLVTGDFNDDGNLDIAAANYGGSVDSPELGGGANVGVLLGNGQAGFAPTAMFSSGGFFALSITTGDFNNDGAADLAVANSRRSISNQGDPGVGVLLGDGDGSFAAAVTFDTGGLSPWSIAIDDFNGDGNADLAVVNQNGLPNIDTVGVLQGDGHGAFASAVTFPSGGSGARALVARDLNNDAKADLAVANAANNNLAVLLNSTLDNQPPVNTVPGDQVAFEDVAKAITGLSVADDDADGILTVTLAAGGTLTVNENVAGGLTVADIAGNGTQTVTLTGTQARINATLAALDGVTYLGAYNFSGFHSLTMTTTDAGGLSDTDVVTIEVLNAQQQADLLAAIIADLGDDGALNGGQENSLLKKLGFLSSLGAEDALQAFVNQVDALLNAGILTEAQRDELIGAAEAIIAGLQ